MTDSGPHRLLVAVIGGSTAGAEVADKLAARGALCVVFEQNERPYGKVEDGLPLWHRALRRKEYDLIDAKLARPEVHFVPRTRIGQDVSFAELVHAWGFDVVILAQGAWRDRPLPVTGADAYVGRGLVYQNPLIYWFNHYRQPGYAGPAYELDDGTIVVGGGLASIDVLKVLQIETTLKALAERGIAADMWEMENEGIPETLARHGLDWAALHLEGCTLYYRRRIEDMPLAEAPARATAEQLRKTEQVRRRILDKAQSKYCFKIEPLWAPIGLLTEGERLAGLRFARTRIDEAGKAEVISGGEQREVRAKLVVSSIGSVPEPIQGLDMHGELLSLTDTERAQVAGYPNVFGCGNVVTGKGNLVASRKHSSEIAAMIAERFASGENGRNGADRLESLLRRVRDRQRQVGYASDYRTWIMQATPPGFA
jgi:ferredoxin--NADP+ reductase